MESFLAGRSVVVRDKSTPGGVSQTSGFQPLFSPPPVGSTNNTSQEVEAEPTVEIVRGDDGIQRIIVTCTCCKRIELQCEYE